MTMEMNTPISAKTAGLSVFSPVQPVKSPAKETTQTAADPTDTMKSGHPRAMRNLSSQVASKMILDGDFSTRVWKMSIPCHYTAQPVIGKDEKVYMGSDNGTVMRVDIKTGKKDWQFHNKDSKKMSDPIINEQGDLIVLADLHTILILDGNTGNKKHELQTDTFSPSSPAWGPRGSVIITSMADGVFNKEGKIYAIDPWQQGHSSFLSKLNPFYREHPDKLWEVSLGEKSLMDLSVVNPDGKPRNVARLQDTIFYSDREKRLVALDEATGKKQWQFPVKGEWLFDPFIVDGTSIGSATKESIFALDAKTGKKLWSVECGGIFGAPSSDGKGTIFYRPDPQSLAAIENGNLKWSKKTEFSPLIIPPVTDKFGGVYVVAREGNKTTISALDGATGDLRFRLNTAGDVLDAPVISPEGRIMVKVKDGDSYQLCCYESPFNPDVTASIPESKPDAVEEMDGWVNIGGVRLPVNER
jgi:outer membrane protein assembly factor BamB